MIFKEAGLYEAYIIEPEKLPDERGFFARTYCLEEFSKIGIDFKILQCSISFNKKKGTLRGLHYQCAPHEEAKIVRCTRGAIWDVVVDIRRHSPTFKKWISVELNQDNDRAIIIPKGCAHGFQSLTENTVVYYQMNVGYHAESARGFNYLDPAFSIKWPIKDITISAKDKELAFLNS
jgi:dTDP-4-dehydrorhamnose 3,5-epimerase